MSDDLISRQAAKDYIDTYESPRIGHTLGEILKIMLDKVPSAQEHKTGRWIDMGDFEQCSVCTGTRLKEIQTMYGKAIWIRTPYCPNCGARMVKGEEHEG